MQTITRLDMLRAARAALKGRVALVPTMGALHAGHVALIDEARRHADHVVASIFVNPLQFGANEDLSRYPRREAEDAAMLADAGVAMLWRPDAATMYPDGFATHISVGAIGERFEGAARPGHFDGVATVVAKLFGQVRPDLAVFGEKDWQQLAVIRRMIIDLDLGIEIAGVPTVRDADGLALSSRNAYLTPGERATALALPAALHALRGRTAEADYEEARARLEAAGLAVDYIERVDHNFQVDRSNGSRLIAAVRVGTTRLIDNMPAA